MSPILHDLLKARLAIVREDLEEVLGRLSEDDLDWAPTPGMRTVRGQLIEIAATERQLLTWITDQRHLTYQEAEDFGEHSQTLDGLKQVLAGVRQQTSSVIDSLTAEELEAPFPFPERWFESLRQPHAPRAEAFRSVAQHEWYHTGQLVSYLWSRGDNPYKW